jgi:hypothetical protein
MREKSSNMGMMVTQVSSVTHLPLGTKYLIGAYESQYTIHINK